MGGVLHLDAIRFTVASSAADLRARRFQNRHSVAVGMAVLRQRLLRFGRISGQSYYDLSKVGKCVRPETACVVMVLLSMGKTALSESGNAERTCFRAFLGITSVA
ncbi:unnamed protein product [Caenorhabditis auriculariae]|uniref:Uncharacterized protein n=1 Tax=Caenorhabditis auriculariae TaxID=2777116 RepID=A0A8S1HAE2_9PELO|nr:unnamed protein product [Caenorhabditis auriculariae]